MKRGMFFTALLLGFVLSLQGVGAAELRWEIERNFRYFLYPSDVEIQRVARDIYETQNKEPPNVEQLEGLINGKPGFWSTRLLAADNAHRKNWPTNWPSGENVTVYDLLKFMRREEARPSLNSILCPPGSLQICKEAEELGRLGWASLLVEPYSSQIPTGSTDTCWQPLNRLHSNCNSLWGDYVRPEGWIVRVYAPDAPPGAKCDWSLTGAAFADDDISHFKANLKAAMRLEPDEKQARQNVACETRIVVPSNNREMSVSGRALVEWTLNETGQTPSDVAPADRLILGLGDSFTSGEGNPERPPWFNNEGSGDAALPVRQSDLIPGKPAFDTRAQWTDRWCHRSVYSWQIRSALDTFELLLLITKN